MIHSKAAYIGMIGSKRKVRTIMEQFIKEGIATAEEFRRVHSPMGLAIRSIHRRRNRGQRDGGIDRQCAAASTTSFRCRSPTSSPDKMLHEPQPPQTE